jgi:nicotinate-nucleotide--dimethylbenzimidazole phosphoribosyltransferase
MRTLVLGGIRSGKSEWAEQLAVRLAGAAGTVVYAATAPDRPDDAEWAARIAAHQKRRPGHWETAEVGASPDMLAATLRSAVAGSVLLIDDIGGWLAAVFDALGAWDAEDPLVAIAPAADELLDALEACAGQVVVVSPEVGLTVVPETRAGRLFVDAQGTLNQALASVCSSCVLIVAGRALQVGAVEGATAAAMDHGAALRAAAAGSVDLSAPGVSSTVSGELFAGAPDWAAGEGSVARLAAWSGAPGVLGELAQWIGSTRGSVPFSRVRCVVFAADHGIATSSEASAASALLDGEGLLPLLAHRSGATIRLVDVGLSGEPLPGAVSANRIRAGSGALDKQNALTPSEVEAALALGERLADEEVDSGTDLVIPVILSRSAIIPATVLIAALCQIEPIRALGFDAYLPDLEWIRQAEAVRDGVHRVHAAAAAVQTRQLLAVGGGLDLVVAAAFLARAAARRTPALIDGVGAAAAALVARQLAPEAPGWFNAPHGSGRAGEREAFGPLNLRPAAELGVQLADGAGALLALPLVTAAADLVAAAPVGDPVPYVEDPDEVQSFPGEWNAGSQWEPSEPSEPSPGLASSQQPSPGLASSEQSSAELAESGGGSAEDEAAAGQADAAGGGEDGGTPTRTGEEKPFSSGA